MSDGAIPAGAVRERINPRRAAPAHPLSKSPWPWNDRSGRFSRLKSVALLLQLAPAAWITFALLTHRLGARPVHEANHETGLWMVRFLLVTMMITPARAIFNWHRLVLIRRQVGLTALFYGLAHVLLYAWDENWNGVKVAMEILDRFYLEVGFVALVGLAVLGVTSTDRALRRLGHGWKRLHRTIHLIVLLGLFHFFLQAKADVSEATLMAGLFVWAMAWRLLPSGPDREPLPILGLSVFAGLATAAIEFAWYGLATRIDPVRALKLELNVAYGPHPAGQVLLVCLCLTVAASLFWASHRERLRRSAGFDVALYGGGALIAAALAFAFNLTDDWLPEDWMFWQAAACFVPALALLGLLRRVLPRGRLVLDVICAVVLLLPIVAGFAV